MGGGTSNTAFLVGTKDGPNADAAHVVATFWLQTLQGDTEPKRLQYSQTVLLNFAGLSWPHITVATLTKAWTSAGVSRASRIKASRRLAAPAGPADMADAQIHDAAKRALAQADQRPYPLGQIAHLRGPGDVDEAEGVKATASARPSAISQPYGSGSVRPSVMTPAKCEPDSEAGDRATATPGGRVSRRPSATASFWCAGNRLAPTGSAAWSSWRCQYRR